MAQQATTRQVVAEAAYVYDGPLTVRQVIGEVAYEQRGLGQETRARQVLAEVAWIPMTGDLYALGNDLGDYEGDERGVPLSSDRSAWDDVNYPERHAKGMEEGDSHHPAVTLGPGSDPALTLDGQELTLADVLTPDEHAATDHSGYDETAIHEDESGEIHAITEKETPEDNDEILIEDSGASYVKKRVKIANLPAGSGGSGTLANAGYQETVGDGVNTEFTVTHSLGTWDVLVQVYDLGVTPREQVGATVEVTSADAVVVTIEPAPATDQIRVLVVAADVSAVGDAADLTYTPAEVTDWDSDTDPGNTDDALDQLAERVDDLESAPAPPADLDDLADVNAPAPDDGDVLTWDAVAEEWVPEAPAGGGGASDAADLTYTPVALADWDGAADPGNADDAFDQLAERVADLEDIPGGTDANAIHDNQAGEIAAIAEKTSPASTDLILIEDSADSNAKKRVQIGNLPSGGGDAWDYQTLVDGATISWDLSNGNAQVTLGGDRTLANPTNMTAGALYWLRVIQDGTGGREISWGTAYRFPQGLMPTLTPYADAEDVLLFACDGTNMYHLLTTTNLDEPLYIYTEVGAFEWPVPSGVTSVTVLVVGGGGGGGDRVGGGGGGGGVVLDTDYDVSAVSSVIGSVGAGGVGYFGTSSTPGGNGGDSTFGTLTALGGGGGGSYQSNGQDGGSGGGGAGYVSNSVGGSATDTNPPSGVYQGHDGGDPTANYGAGGGGGAGEVGDDGGASNVGGNGGDGLDMSAYVGSGVGDGGWFGAGGGGGGYDSNLANRTSGGRGGGGAGGLQNYSPSSGMANTGGGGGGRERYGERSDGGSGVVIIKVNGA